MRVCGPCWYRALARAPGGRCASSLAAEWDRLQKKRNKTAAAAGLDTTAASLLSAGAYVFSPKVESPRKSNPERNGRTRTACALESGSRFTQTVVAFPLRKELGLSQSRLEPLVARVATSHTSLLAALITAHGHAPKTVMGAKCDGTRRLIGALADWFSEMPRRAKITQMGGAGGFKRTCSGIFSEKADRRPTRHLHGR